MPNLMSKIYVQLIMAIDSQEHFLQQEWLLELYENIKETIEAYDHELLAISAAPDHIHIFVRWQPDMSVEDLYKKIKTQSTKFVNEQKWLKTKTLWQDVYAAFSSSHSQVEAMVNYIKNQEAYHKTKSFKEEFMNFASKYEIECEEEDMFDFF